MLMPHKAGIFQKMLMRDVFSIQTHTRVASVTETGDSQDETN